jgi:hypothetical protein
MAVQNRNVNVAAITARETPACAARADTAPTAELLLVDVLGLFVLGLFEAAAGVPDEAPDRGGLDRVVMLTPVLEVDDPVVVEGVTEEDVLLADVDETGLVLLLLPVRYGGGGTAVEGSASPPVPHGMAWPLGWFAFGGGTVEPVESAIANRPVHVMFPSGTPGALNW